MARIKFTHYVPRDKPKKLGPGRHKKRLTNQKSEIKNSLDTKVKADNG